MAPISMTLSDLDVTPTMTRKI